jgi:methionine-rich copper-binding protein CopC
VGGRRIGRWALVVLGVVVLLVGGSGVAPAWAHAQMLRSDPADGSTVTAPLREVTLVFNEVIQGDFSTVVITDPDGVRVNGGPLRAVDKTVHQPTSALRSGDYRVVWRVVSADGHPIQGQFRFTVALPSWQEPTTPPAATPSSPVAAAAAAPAEEDDGNSGWWWGGAAASAALVAVLLVLVRRRGVGAR